MRKLIAVTYDTEFKAEEVRLQFLKMQKSYLVSLEDAVVVEKKQNGKVKLHQMYNLTASGAVGGGFWGVLIGLIFMNPLLGLVVGAGAGAVAGALSDVGINDDFMKQLAEKLTPGTSACSFWSTPTSPTRCSTPCAAQAGPFSSPRCPTRTKPSFRPP